MSRIGKSPVIIPSGVTISYDDSARVLSVKGQLGELVLTIHPLVSLEITEAEVKVLIEDPTNKLQRSLWGTTRALINNLVQGVTQGFKKELELNGVGYRMELGTELTLHIGFSHPVKVVIPSSIKLNLEKNLLTGTSPDKQALGNFFSYIHNLKPCDPYKHKGFKYPGRFYVKKVGKKKK